MKSILHIAFIFLTINLVFLGCTHHKSSENSFKKIKMARSDGQVHQIDLKRLPNLQSVKISEIGATEVRYIPLETSSQYVIPQINNILFSKSYLITKGISSLHMFGIDGVFITELGKKGRGPNEYSGISDIDINDENEEIYIANGGQHKFLVYNKRGEFLRTFESPSQARSRMKFRILGDGILCYYLNDRGDIDNSYILIDTVGGVIKTFKNKYPYTKKAPGVFFDNENLFYKFNNQLFKKEMYCDTIFAYKNKGFEPHLIINVGNQRLTPDIRSQIKMRSDAESVLHNFINPWNLFEFGDFIYYEMAITLNGRNDLFAFLGSINDNFKAMVVPYEGLINDLDGGPNLWPKTVMNDSTFVSWIEALKLKQYIASDAFKNSSPLYPEKKRELEKLANSVQENDNPIIILIKVKRSTH